MNKKFLLNTFLLAGAMMFAACDYNEDNFDGLSDGHIPTDVKKTAYTLAPADYKAISTDKGNIASAGDEGKDALTAVGKNFMFNNGASVKKYLPAFLAKRYFTADEGSAVQVTYNQEYLWNDALKAINVAPTHEVGKEEYQKIWGADYNFFTPENSAESNIPEILADTLGLSCDSGAIALVNYKFSAIEPAGAPSALEEPFDNYWEPTGVDSAEVEDWLNVTTKGSLAWKGKNHNDNNFIQSSAFRHEGELETYMITRQFMVKKDMRLSFKACYGYYKEEGGRLSVLILKSNEDLSEFTPQQIAEAKWEDITEGLNIPIPEGSYGDMQTVYNRDLSDYAGEYVYVAFRYNGNGTAGATTTVQLDDVLVNTLSLENKSEMYQFDGTAWKPFNRVYLLTDADFEMMGLGHHNFSSSSMPEKYLPRFLATKYPFAQEGKTVNVAYKFYANKNTSLKGATYVFTNGAWTYSETVTSQFVLAKGEWKYDPSMVISLSTQDKNAAKPYYQAVCDWVWKTLDQEKLGLTEKGQGYLTKYGDSEFYSGCSAHHGNVSFSFDDFRKCDQDLAGKSDADVEKVVVERLKETLKVALEKVHPDAKPEPGLDVIYTIKFMVYRGTAPKEFTNEIKYRVVAPGKFEYVEKSYIDYTKK